MGVLCIDAGTTMVKSVLFDDDGREAAVARQATSVTAPEPGWSEQDMYSVWDAVVHTVRQVVHGGEVEVSIVAVTGQGDGCWLVGEDGRPTGPAILWNDGRAAEIVDAWDAEGRLTDAFRVNGNLAFPGTQNAILTWLHRHDPERLERSHRALYCDGWLYHRLTGRLAVEESDAASPFLDLAERAYSPAILEMFDMPWAQRLLPEVLSGPARVGTLLDTPATELRLPARTPVVMAPFDIPSTAIGIGAVRPGSANSVLGTTLSTQVSVAGADTSGVVAGMTLPIGVGDIYTRSIPAMAGVGVVTWAMQLIGLDNPNWLSDLAASSVPGARGLFIHPYLSPAGERAPFRDTHARGSMVGLSFEHTRSDVARAALEGLSYVVRDCLRFGAESVSELRLCGGGANSAFWCQLLADVTGAPTARSTDSEIGAKGAYLTAVTTVTGEDMAAAVDRTVTLRDRFEPDPGRSAAYDELFDDFLALREGLAGQWRPLAAVRSRLGAVSTTR